MDEYDSTLLDSFDPALRKAYEVHNEVRSEKDHNKVRISKSNVLLSGDATFATLQGEGVTIGMPCVFCRLHVCNLRCTWCLAKGTVVQMVNGAEKNIEDIKPGDYVVGSDSKPSRVEETQIVIKSESYLIELEDSTIIKCSAEHEFWVKDKWVRADNLVIGAELTTTPNADIVIPYGQQNRMSRVS